MSSSHGAIKSQLVETKREEKSEIKQEVSPRAAAVAASSFSLNIIFLGTAYHRSRADSQNILTELAKRIVVNRQQLVHLIDGPGGVPTDDERKAHPMLGTYEFFCEYNDTQAKLLSQKTAKSAMDKSLRSAGLIAGSGCKDAILEAVKVCEAVTNQIKLPITINLFGYSRGGDTALRAANAIQSRFGRDQISINIFAIDPVPGTGRRKEMNARLIPGIVSEYRAILMEDETTPGFEAQDRARMIVQTPEYTKVQYHIYGGFHGSSIRVNAESKNNPAAVTAAFLVSDDLHRFVASKGIQLSEPIPILQSADEEKWKDVHHIALNDLQRFDHYTQIKSLEKERKKGGLFERGFVNRKLDYMIHGADYFLSKEHQELFKQIYPGYFDYFFQCHKEKISFEQISSDLKKIRENKKLASTLLAAGYPIPQENEPLSKPKGVMLIADKQFSNNEVLVKDELSWILFAVNTAANTEKHFSGVLSSAPEMATVLQTEVKHILLNPPACIHAKDYDFYYLAMIKIAAYKACLELDDADQYGKIVFQLHDVIRSDPYVKLFYECLKKIDEKEDKNNLGRETLLQLITMVEIQKNLKSEEKETLETMTVMRRMLRSDPLVSEKVKNKIIPCIKEFVENFKSIKALTKSKDLQVESYIVRQLQNYVSGFGHVVGGRLSDHRIILSVYIQQVLMKLQKLNDGNHASVLSEVIYQAAVAASRLRVAHQRTDEGNLEKIFLKLQGVLSVFRRSPLDDAEKKFLKSYEENLGKLVQRLVSEVGQKPENEPVARTGLGL